MSINPIHEFHIRPERGSRLSVKVEVYKSLTALRRMDRLERRCATGKRRVPNQTIVGQCIGVSEFLRKEDGSRRKTSLFAIVRLARGCTNTATITHEAFHATMRWAARRGATSISTIGTPTDRHKASAQSMEERCANVHDEMCRRIVNELHRRKVLNS